MYHAGLRKRECAIAPLTIASEARDLPRTWEAPDPSEIPLPRFVTMLPDILSMMERGEARVCDFVKRGMLRKGPKCAYLPVRDPVLILEQQLQEMV